jgi:hypothetical protein
MRRIILLATAALLMTAMLAVLSAGTAAAHPHVVNNPADKPDHEQQIAHGQNHPGYSYDAATNLSTSCDTSATPGDPAFYGLESAHHGPDAGDPGKDEGCYAAEEDPLGPPPPDTNPAID